MTFGRNASSPGKAAANSRETGGEGTIVLTPSGNLPLALPRNNGVTLTNASPKRELIFFR